MKLNDRHYELLSIGMRLQFRPGTRTDYDACLALTSRMFMTESETVPGAFVTTELGEQLYEAWKDKQGEASNASKPRRQTTQSRAPSKVQRTPH